MRRITLLAVGLGVAGLLAGSLAVAAVAAPTASSGSTSSGSAPAWAGNPRLDGAAQIAANVLQGIGPTTSLTLGTSPGCPAEASTTGNVQVNCVSEDGTSPQNTQSETSVAVSGQKVVVGFNDSLVCCTPALNLTGYSASNDGGKSFTDMGTLPFRPNVQPIGDPAVTSDGQGNFYFASLALGSDGVGAHSLISFYEMPKGSDTFQLVSVPVDVGSGQLFFADKEYLAVGRDTSGQLHFYITWTFFSSSPASPIMLTQSTDGVHWTTTTVSASDACAQSSNPVPAGNAVYVSWEQSVPAGCTNAQVTAADEMMATAETGTGKVSRISTIAAVQGSGDAIVACNNAADLREVIQTQPGHDVRNFEMPSTTIDPHGTLYAVWNDRPAGVGGDASNATRILLSFPGRKQDLEHAAGHQRRHDLWCHERPVPTLDNSGRKRPARDVVQARGGYHRRCDPDRQGGPVFRHRALGAETGHGDQDQLGHVPRRPDQPEPGPDHRQLLHGRLQQHRLQRHHAVRDLGRQPERRHDHQRHREPAGRIPAKLLTTP